MTIAERKQQLRRHAATLPKMEVAHLLERFLDLPQVKRAHTVMVFYGVDWEPNTLPLIRALMARAKRVALPVCLPQRGMEARILTSPGKLVQNAWGIPEPDGSCPVVLPEKVQALLVPHLMCDREGYRLGRGGGYYDRWLARCHGFTVAVCPPERLVERLPRDWFDLPVHLILHD